MIKIELTEEEARTLKNSLSETIKVVKRMGFGGRKKVKHINSVIEKVEKVLEG